MNRLGSSAIALLNLGATAAPPFAFDSQSATEMATAYLRAEPFFVEGRKLNYDRPQVFAAVGQLGRHFIVVGFDSSGDPGGSFVILEACPEAGPVVIVTPGALQDFTSYRRFVTEAISGPVAVPNFCPK
jgi:hypothetical protein